MLKRLEELSVDVSTSEKINGAVGLVTRKRRAFMKLEWKTVSREKRKIKCGGEGEHGERENAEY